MSPCSQYQYQYNLFEQQISKLQGSYQETHIQNMQGLDTWTKGFDGKEPIDIQCKNRPSCQLCLCRLQNKEASESVSYLYCFDFLHNISLLHHLWRSQGNSSYPQTINPCHSFTKSFRNGYRVIMYVDVLSFINGFFRRRNHQFHRLRLLLLQDWEKYE